MSNTQEPDDAAPSGRPAVDRLRSVLVTYEGAPDRRTLYPQGASDAERLTHWLTADADAFDRLDERR